MNEIDSLSYFGSLLLYFGEMGHVMENLDPTLLAQIENDGVGPFLRRSREGKDIPLRAISEQTRIRTYYLESIENSEFDKLPAGPVGLGFVRAFADAVGVDSHTVAAGYKREIAGEISVEELGLETESRILYSTPPRVNRFSSVATLVFVLIFLIAGGGLLWFMKGRTEKLVPVGSIVERIQTAVAPVTEKLPRLNEANEKAKGVNGAREDLDGIEKKPPEQESPPVSTVNLEKTPVAQKEEKPSPGEDGVPSGRRNSAAEARPSTPEQPPVRVRESASVQTRESPRAPAAETPPVQANARGRQAPTAPEVSASRENPPAPQNPSAQAAAPASENPSAQASAPPERLADLDPQAARQEQQVPAAPAQSASVPASPTPNALTPAAAEDATLTLKIYATEDTWLRIVVDAKDTEELLLLAGRERDWKASEKFALTVGNVAGTQISLNGSEVTLPQSASNVLRDFVITKKYLN